MIACLLICRKEKGIRRTKFIFLGSVATRIVCLIVVIILYEKENENFNEVDYEGIPVGHRYCIAVGCFISTLLLVAIGKEFQHDAIWHTKWLCGIFLIMTLMFWLHLYPLSVIQVISYFVQAFRETKLMKGRPVTEIVLAVVDSVMIATFGILLFSDRNTQPAGQRNAKVPCLMFLYFVYCFLYAGALGFSLFMIITTLRYNW